MTHATEGMLADADPVGQRVSTRVGRSSRAVLGALGLIIAQAVSCGASDEDPGPGRGGTGAGGTSAGGTSAGGTSAGGTLPNAGRDPDANGGRTNAGGRTFGGAPAGGVFAGGGGANAEGGAANGGTESGGTWAGGGTASAGSGGAGGAVPEGGAAGTGGLTDRSLDLRDVDPASLEGSKPPPGLDEARARARTVLEGLTIAEKVALVHGSGSGSYVGNVRAVTGVPALTLQDGPAGVARFRGVTAFPAPIALAATWDRELVERWGKRWGPSSAARA